MLLNDHHFYFLSSHIVIYLVPTILFLKSPDQLIVFAPQFLLNTMEANEVMQCPLLQVTPMPTILICSYIFNSILNSYL